MPKNVRRDFASRREEIIHQSTELFARFGYKKTTVAAIAGGMGLVKGALYAYFQDKEDIYLACFEEQADRLRRQISKYQEPNLSAQENLLRFFDTAAAAVAQSPFLIKALEGDCPAGSRLFSAQVELYELEAARMVEGILRSGKTNGAMAVDNPGLTARTLVRLFYHLLKAKYSASGSGDDVAEQTAELLRLVVRGLAAPAVLSARQQSPDWWQGRK